jgi:hypothetical protein
MSTAADDRMALAAQLASEWDLYDSDELRREALAEFAPDLTARQLAGLLDLARGVRERGASTNGNGEPSPAVLPDGEELAAERAQQVAELVEHLAERGWSDRALRLVDSDAYARDARRELAELLKSHRLTKPEATELIERVAYGLTNVDGVMDLTADPEPHEVLIDGLLVRGYLHSVYGDRGTLKTLMLVWACCVLAENGQHSILFEYEMPPALLARLIDDLGFDRAAMLRYFHVIEPTEAGQVFSAALVSRYLARWPETVLVGLDNLGEALDDSDPDASENSAGDSRRMLRIMRTVSRRGSRPATVVIDHTGVSGGRARGSTAKGQAVDVELDFTLASPLRRDHIGKLEVVCRKDRTTEIGLGRKWAYEIGDGDGGLPISEADPNALSDPSDAWGEVGAKLREALRKHDLAARDAGADDRSITQSALCDRAGITKGGARRRAVGVLTIMANDTERSGVKMTTKRHGKATRQLFEWVEPQPEGGDNGLPL